MALKKARARHILVATEKACNDLKAEIEKWGRIIKQAGIQPQ